MKVLINAMGQRGWVQAINLVFFSLAVAFTFNLCLPIDWLPARIIDLSQPDGRLLSTRTLAASEIIGFADPVAAVAVETTPPRWLEDVQGLGNEFQPRRRYLVPLRSDRKEDTGDDFTEYLIAVSIITDGELSETLKSIDTSLRGRLRLPKTRLMGQSFEADAATALAESTEHEQVLILDRLDGSASCWLVFMVFGYLTLAAAAVLYTETVPKCICSPSAAILILIGGESWWLFPKLSPTWSSIETMVTPAMASAGFAMLLAALLFEIAARFRKDTLNDFRFNLQQQFDDDQLTVGEDYLRLVNAAGTVTIRDADVQSITWWHILSYVDKQIVKGYFMSIITHCSDEATPAQTIVKTDFEDPQSNYDPKNDRLAAYRFRVADLRATFLAEQLVRTGKTEGDGWSIDRQKICFQPGSGRQIRFPRSALQDCCYIEEELSIYHAESELPVRVTSNAPDQLIFGRVLKTLVTDESTAALESRAEGRILARFTSNRMLMKNCNMPVWAMHLNAYLLLIVPMVISRWLQKHHPNPIAGVLPVFWFLAVYVVFALCIRLLYKSSARHLDLCEKGLRLSQGRSGRFVQWDSISHANLGQRRVAGNGQHATTAYTLGFTINEEAKPAETVSFTWDSASACCGEITALGRFVEMVGSGSGP